MALAQVTMPDFHGPDCRSYQWSVTLHSDNVTACTRVQPELASTPSPAGREACIHATKCERNTTMRAVDAVVVWKLELTCRLLGATFQFTPRSWKSSVLLRNCSARTWTHAPFESWIGEYWAEPLRIPFERAIRPEVWNQFRCGTKQNARVQRWHDFQPDVLIFKGSTRQRLLARRLWRAWASVATRHSCSCARLSISPSLCVLLSECCLPTTSRQC